MNIKLIIIVLAGFAAMPLVATDACGSKPASTVDLKCPSCTKQTATVVDPNSGQEVPFPAWCVTNGATQSDECFEFGDPVKYNYKEWDGTCTTNKFRVVGCDMPGNPNVQGQRADKIKIYGSCPFASAQGPIQLVSRGSSGHLATLAKSETPVRTVRREVAPTPAAIAARASRPFGTE